MGKLGLVKDKDSTAADLSNGRPILFRIQFPLQAPLPRPLEMHRNRRNIGARDEEVCCRNYFSLKFRWEYFVSSRNRGKKNSSGFFFNKSVFVVVANFVTTITLTYVFRSELPGLHRIRVEFR